MLEYLVFFQYFQIKTGPTFNPHTQKYISNGIRTAFQDTNILTKDVFANEVNLSKINNFVESKFFTVCLIFTVYLIS